MGHQGISRRGEEGDVGNGRFNQAVIITLCACFMCASFRVVSMVCRWTGGQVCVLKGVCTVGGISRGARSL
jgi:1,4-dihydroxy-2-naphthoate octaprenyltransferase